MPVLSQLILDLTTSQLSPEEAELIQPPCVSGVILFSRNIETAEQVADLAKQLKQLKPNLLLAVDQEGGRVQRLTEGFTQLPPVASLGKLYLLDEKAACQAAQLLGRLMASEVIQVGLDLSFAPVLDLDYATSQVIGDRAFSASASTVIQLATAYIAGMDLAGMAATGKHFPGHGFVSADSHLELPVDERSLAELEASCLQPFKALTNQLAGVMPAHIVYSQIDDQPAGFSAKWLSYLRNNLGFTGTIFSDDLSMAGAASLGCYRQRAEAALLAGCDQLLVCNNPAGAKEVMAYLSQAKPSSLQATKNSFQTATGKLTPLLVKPSKRAEAVSWLASREAKLAKQIALALKHQDFTSALQQLSQVN